MQLMKELLYTWVPKLQEKLDKSKTIVKYFKNHAMGANR